MPGTSLFSLIQDLRIFSDKLEDQQRLSRIGLGGIRNIKERTRRGVDVDGRPFEPYSEGHARKRRAKGLPTSRVDLKFSLYDGMMDQIDHVIARDLRSVAIVIEDDEKEQLAVYHNIEGAGRSRVIREFFGLSDDEIDAIEELVGDDIDDQLDDLNLS